MDKLRNAGCRWMPLARSVGWCHVSYKTHDTKRAIQPESPLEARQNTAPDGQVLPDWLTWSAYETTVGEQVFQTGEILQLPLTYYGPSIPLGPDWTYGGLTSPVPQESPSPTFTPTPSDPAGSIEQTAIETAEPDTSSDVVSSEIATASGTAAASSGDIASEVVDETPAIQTGAGPASPLGQTIPSLTSTPAFATPSVIGPSPFATSASSPPSILTFSNSASPTIPPGSDQSYNEDLVPILPAIIVPLLTALILLILVIWCCRRRERSQQGYTTALGASSGGYGGWLTSSFAKRANGSGERFTSAWTQVPDADVDRSNPGEREVTKEASPVSPVSAANWASSNEGSALLGFIPHHHRTSSSIDTSRPSAPLVHNEKAGSEKEGEIKEDELEVLADRNRSLLGRLNLGLGWLSAASLSSARSRGSATANAQARVASGHTLERGNGGAGALGRPQSQDGSGGSGARTPAGSGSNGQPGSGSGGREPTTSESAAAGADASNEKLFFRAPLDTASLSSSPSPRAGFFGRWKTGSASSKSKRSSGPSRRSWVSSNIVVEGDEDAPLHPTPEGISLAMPMTPSTLGEGDKDKIKKATRWDSKEKLKFPIPPSGGGSTGERESLISSLNTEYHSAESHYSAPSGPPTEHTPTPEPTFTTRQPFDKSHTNYAEPALSPFGSRESIAPAKVVAGRTPTQAHISGTSMRDLFSASPSGPARPSIDSGSGGAERRSYVGQPIIDDTLLQAISTGRGTYAGLGGINEFGQTVRAVSGEAPTIVSTARWSRSHESEMASYHSGPSSSSSHSTGHREMLAESDETTIKSHALRGRRSQPQLIQAPMMARLTPTPVSRTSSDSGDHAPMGWTRRWGG